MYPEEGFPPPRKPPPPVCYEKGHGGGGSVKRVIDLRDVFSREASERLKKAKRVTVQR